MAIHSSYLSGLIEPKTLKLIVDTIVGKMTEDLVQGLAFDAIAVRGTSGTVVGGALSLATGLPLVIVRKPGDGTHSSYQIECDDSFKRYVIIDDLISSGATMQHIVNAINDAPFQNQGRKSLVKVYLYAQDTQPQFSSMEKFGLVPVYAFKPYERDNGTRYVDGSTYTWENR